MATSFAEKNKRYIGDIRPHTVFLTSDGNLKMWPANIFPDDMSLYKKIKAKEQRCLIAPESLADYYQGVAEPAEDQNRVDSFQTGMTMMEMATLTSTSLCYDYQNFTFNKQFFDDLYTKFNQNSYSPLLKGFINLHLLRDPNQRLTPLQAYNLLKPYECQILALQPFQMKQPNLDEISSYAQINCYDQLWGMLNQDMSYIQTQVVQQQVPVSVDVPVQETVRQ